MTQEFYFQIIVTLLGIFGAVFCVILGWYLKKRETCNRRKEELQERLVRKVDEMSAKLDHHIENSKREIQRIGKAEQEIQRIGKLV